MAYLDVLQKGPEKGSRVVVGGSASLEREFQRRSTIPGDFFIEKLRANARDGRKIDDAFTRGTIDQLWKREAPENGRAYSITFTFGCAMSTVTRGDSSVPRPRVSLPLARVYVNWRDKRDAYIMPVARHDSHGQLPSPPLIPFFFSLFLFFRQLSRPARCLYTGHAFPRNGSAYELRARREYE